MEIYDGVFLFELFVQILDGTPQEWRRDLFNLDGETLVDIEPVEETILQHLILVFADLLEPGLVHVTVRQTIHQLHFPILIGDDAP